MNEEAAIVHTTYPEGVRYKPAAFALVSLVIVFVLYQFVGGGLTLIAAGGNFSADNIMLARSATMIAQFVFLLGPTIWLAKRQHGVIGAALKWKIPSLTELIVAVLGMAALLQAAEGYMYFQEKIPLPEDIAPFIEQMKSMIEATYKILIEAHSVPELLFVLLVVAVTPAVCEEVLFRGLVQKNFSLSSGGVRGMIMTGIIFGLYHFNPFQAVPLIALGVYFSFLQYRSQTLWIPMAAHFINNALSVIASYVYGFDNAETPSLLKSGGTEPSDASVFMLSVFFLAAFYFLMKFYVRTTVQPSAGSTVSEEGQ